MLLLRKDPPYERFIRRIGCFMGISLWGVIFG